jgi:hypothetical protein
LAVALLNAKQDVLEGVDTLELLDDLYFARIPAIETHLKLVQFVFFLLKLEGVHFANRFGIQTTHRECLYFYKFFQLEL